MPKRQRLLLVRAALSSATAVAGAASASKDKLMTLGPGKITEAADAEAPSSWR